MMKRRVFYIPGYDPFHPRRYRELYRKQGASQAQISGYQLAIQPKAKSDVFGWQAVLETAETRSEVEMDVLVWSDVVRNSMAVGVFRTYVLLLRTAWIYISSGALFKLMRLRKGPILAAFYPVCMLLGQLILAIIIGLWGGRLGSWLLSHVSVGLGTAWFWASLIILPVLLLGWFKRHDNRIYAHYLMQDFAFSAQGNGAYSADLEVKIAEFKEIIASSISDDIDEVLVVGHSSGAHIAVSILSDLIKEHDLSKTNANLSFLSLGHVVPMVSFLPKANRLRGDLNFLSQRDELTWIDVTAPGDGCAFALCDPVGVTGVASENQKWPVVFSAAFTQSLSHERWRALRWRFFRLHFQYLCAFDRPLDYDYFQITAGPLTLAERYKDRKPSKSRLFEAVSGHRSM
ncbi:MAG: hypothetical protein ABJ327_15070 [Litoreibacter sp.]